jgi:hypothetical protein
MPHAPRFSKRLATTAACGAVLATALAGAQGACITTPPPDLPAESLRPTILHDSVFPFVNQPLTAWPVDGQFNVPVQLNDPDELFCWVVFVDYTYNPYNSNGTATGLVGDKHCEVAPPAQFDAGVVVISFTIDPQTTGIDTTLCHQIEFLVAENFEGDNHTPVSPPGGDDVFWTYDPAGVACGLYDAGAFADGAFPADAPSDTLLVTPPSPDGAAGDDSGSP